MPMKHMRLNEAQSEYDPAPNSIKLDRVSRVAVNRCKIPLSQFLSTTTTAGTTALSSYMANRLLDDDDASQSHEDVSHSENKEQAKIGTESFVQGPPPADEPIRHKQFPVVFTNPQDERNELNDNDHPPQQTSKPSVELSSEVTGDRIIPTGTPAIKPLSVKGESHPAHLNSHLDLPAKQTSNSQNGTVRVRGFTPSGDDSSVQPTPFCSVHSHDSYSKADTNPDVYNLSRTKNPECRIQMSPGREQLPASAQLGKWDGALDTISPIKPRYARDSVVNSSPHSRTVYDGQWDTPTQTQETYNKFTSIGSMLPFTALLNLPQVTRQRQSVSSNRTATESPGFPVSGTSVTSQQTVLSGATLSFHHITYEVKLKKMPWSKPVTKTVLSDISGILRPGVNALMGPTGSGKSSLLDVLAGRKDPRFLTGQVLVDGVPQPKDFKCLSGYVVQDDIVMGTLTVRENLNFSAALRLTVQCSKEERRRKVDALIEELGLTPVADSKIGTDLIRGVSGGERKRTSIGMELITDPPVLFLDEPTTGLDAFMAGQVIKTLKNLSRRGRTIIFSIHQPKYSIYKLFDTLTLVYRGRLVYHGKAKHEPIQYFLKLGYVCENHNNPSDFFMDILHGEAVQRSTDNSQGIDPEDVHHNVDEPENIHLVGEHLVKLWEESPEYDKICKEVNAIAGTSQSDGVRAHPLRTKRKGTLEVSYSVPFCHQLHQVCWRTALNLLRDPVASVVQMLVYLFFAISMGVVYYKMDTSLESGIQNRSGLFFFSTLQVVFVNLGSIELFIKERVLFIHENSSGYYRISAYFLSKILCDILPTKVLPVLLFMPITYWMVGLLPRVGAFFFWELILSVTTLASAAIALFISASVTLFGIANVLLSITFVFMMVFGGYLINLKSMAVWISWLRYVSIFRYSLGGLLVNEMTPLTFCPTTNTSTSGVPDTRQCQTGILYLNDQDIPYESTWDLWSNLLGQSIITIFFYILCYIQLRRINKYK
ncbi:unnamed protein product [Calicophoron daubneyi]|uniref:ABC transporter domain-containing protein n=1 Tax=Calicophoron daubneyi TaxID=300641 RepID=A0AAV2T3Y3_CALDB